MNQPHQEFTSMEPTDMLTSDELRQLDLLVDGELETADQKRLLARLDATSPVGVSDPWRQLALAYVESQAWRSDFGTIREAAAADSVASRLAAPIATAPTGGSSAVLVKALLSMAASALLAFGLGIYVAGGDESATSPVDSVAADQGDSRPLLASDIEPIVVPIFVGNNGDELFRDPAEPVMPQHLIEALEQAGQPMRPGQKMVPIQLEDGTEISMPVSELKVRLDETSRRVDALRDKLDLMKDEPAE